MKKFFKKLICVTVLLSIVINATACFWTNKKVSLINDGFNRKIHNFRYDI